MKSAEREKCRSGHQPAGMAAGNTVKSCITVTCISSGGALSNYRQSAAQTAGSVCIIVISRRSIQPVFLMTGRTFSRNNNIYPNQEIDLNVLHYQHNQHKIVLGIIITPRRNDKLKKLNVAVVGATGMVGSTFLKVLEERDFPIGEFHLFSSQRSAGKTITFKGKKYTVEELTETSFDRGIDIALFSAGAGTSKKFAPIAASKGTVVVDNSSAWRMDDDVPLVVPEVNPQDIDWHKGIIANPNCSTIQAVVVLKPLHDRYKIKRIVYSTYQAVSGSGYKGLNDLKDCLEGKAPSFYPYPIVNNALPHIDVFLENGYTKEEMKMVEETRKILGDYSLRITATTVRIPVEFSHSESVNLEFEKDFDLFELKDLLSNSPGIKVVDNPSENLYPLASMAAGTDLVYVGRIRRDESLESGVNLWVVADNIRKGAATNAVQIAELLVNKL